MAVNDIIGLFGGILGAIAFFWNVSIAILSHVHLLLRAEYLEINGKREMTALVTLENRGALVKRVFYSVLLIGPPNQGLFQTIEQVIESSEWHSDRSKPWHSNRSNPSLDILVRKRRSSPFYAPDGLVALIPLPFFYKEQLDIGQETVSYRTLIEGDRLASRSASTIFFLIIIRYPLQILRFRVTADLIIH